MFATRIKAHPGSTGQNGIGFQFGTGDIDADINCQRAADTNIGTLLRSGIGSRCLCCRSG